MQDATNQQQTFTDQELLNHRDAVVMETIPGDESAKSLFSGDEVGGAGALATPAVLPVWAAGNKSGR